MAKLKQIVLAPISSLLLISLITWALVYGLFVILDFGLFISDVKLYWSEAEAFAQSGFDLSLIYTDFHPDHVPAYSILIGYLHGLLPGLNPVVLMQMINLMATLLSVICIYLILEALNVTYSWLGAIVFALFPLIGITYSVYPIADSLACLAVVAAILGYVRDNKGLVAFALAVGPFIHKVTWPILGLLVLIGLWQRRLQWWMVLPLALPMLVYWYFGFQQLGHPLWLLGRYPAFFAERRGLPIFDGLFGAILREGTFKDWIKGAVVMAVYATALWLLIVKSWAKEPVLLAVIIPILLWGTFYSEFLIFPIVRFGKFLIIPLWLYLEHKHISTDSNETLNHKLFKRKLTTVLLISVCLLSQLIWAYYMMLKKTVM